jgi:hypothetical protein
VFRRADAGSYSSEVQQPTRYDRREQPSANGVSCIVGP